MSETTSPVVTLTPSNRKKTSGRHSFGALTKRAFDILISTLGLICLLPLFVVIAILLKNDSKGPIFYKGSRVGKGGKFFEILKFRTMYDRPESFDGAPVTAQDDDRITPLGRILRDTKINELPQLWNVLIGNMSLVGPRPEDPHIAETWSAEVRKEIFSVRPGITSPASVIYRNEESLLKTDNVMATYLESILPSKLRLDQLYVRHRSFWLDLDILLWTGLVLLPKRGGQNPEEELLFIGPITRLFRRYLGWFTIDFIITFIAVAVSGLFFRSLGPLDLGIPGSLAVALALSSLFSLVGVALGMNRVSWSQTGIEESIDLLPATLIAMFAALLANWFWQPEPLLPSAFIVLASTLSFIGYVVVRYRTRLLQAMVKRWLDWRGGAMLARERVLIIGGGETGEFMAWLLKNGKIASAFRAVGFVDDDLFKQGIRIQGLNVLGRRSDIPNLVAKHDIGILIFAIHNISADEREEVLKICTSTGAQILIVPNILGLLKNSADFDSKRLVRDSMLIRTNKQHVPCHYCMATLTPVQIDHWLVDLENTIQAGSLENAGAQVRNLRKLIQTNMSWPNDPTPSPEVTATEGSENVQESSLQ